MTNKMFKVLLINPEYPFHSFASNKDVYEAMRRKPPLGILSIGSYLKYTTDFKVELLDNELEMLDAENILEYIKNCKPCVIGISVVSFKLYSAYCLTLLIKKMFPSIHICWGGPHISIFPKETLHLDKVDSIVIGEGEVPFKRLCERLAKGEPLDNIVGVYTRGNEPSSGQFIAYLHQELDDLPILDFNLLLSKKYRTFLTNERLATLVTTKGCPHRCIFCKLDFQKIRFFSIERTIKQIESYLSQGIKRIEFYDETFNINASRVTQFAQEVIKRRLKFKWVFRGRVDAVNSEMLKSVKAAGCQRIQYGIESGSDKILKILKKGITVEQIEKCFLLTNKHEIDTVAYLMLGNPKETMDDIRQTFEFVKKIRPTFIGYSILNIFPGTEVYRMALEAGIIKDDPWRQYAAFPSENLPVLTWTEYFSHSQLEGLRHKALRDYYLRPEYIFRRMLSAKPKELYYMFQRGFRILTNREA